jgi:cysteinyl-tRNA synthetase
MLKLYNTLTRKKEEFKPIKKDEVGLYTCGPTVYWYQHIGNLRSYVFADILKRVLTYDGFKVKQVINVTDVGHLTSDADEGEDKMEKAAVKEGKRAEDIAQGYYDEFVKDFEKLNIIGPSIWSWATKHIPEQIKLIEELEKKGYTYKTSDGIYFDTSKLDDYGKLAKLKLENLKAGKRIDLGEKNNKTDFALWKFSGEAGVRQQEWDSPWGLGFPGWHIECSAMSSKYLGKHFDIHTGGEDHIPVHHTNEIAQSEAALDDEKNWVNYWMHGAFLNLGGKKMAKSSGKILTISELEGKGIDPLSYRYFLFSAQYRKPLAWSLDSVEVAQTSLRKLKKQIQDLSDVGPVNKEYIEKFEAAINDDLNMPQALAVLHELVKDKDVEGKVATIKKMDEVFGLDLLKVDKLDVPEDVKIVAEERQKFREEKNWDKSDELRDKLKETGWIVKDIDGGFELSKI